MKFHGEVIQTITSDDLKKNLLNAVASLDVKGGIKKIKGGNLRKMLLDVVASHCAKEGIKTIKGDNLEKEVYPSLYRLIRTLEQSMEAHYQEWDRIRSKARSLDNLKNTKTDEEMSQWILNMEQDLIEIIDYLEDIGVRLDDHYQNIRPLLAKFRWQLAAKAGQSV
ncbi:MAG: hypothetical protein ABSA83_22960 [Verrucomicrobiota bacterium]